jgi:DedD protein
MSTAVNNNFQEYDPRHRLTGAVVLILLAIILLPMLLSKSPDDQGQEAEPVVMEVTKEGKKVFVSRITSVDPAKQAAVPEAKKPAEKVSSSEDKKTDKVENSDQGSSALFKPMSHTTATKTTSTKSSTTKPSAAKAKSGTVSSSKPAVKKTTSKTSTSTSKPTVAKKSSTAAVSGAWILQVGVFSQSANASKKVSELKKKGFNAKSGKVKTSKGVATKVWIGPFKDRASAEKMQDRLQHKTRQRGMVVKK